mgnify:CR=1 FL=1
MWQHDQGHHQRKTHIPPVSQQLKVDPGNLEGAGGHRVAVVGAGRTDAGVHARMSGEDYVVMSLAGSGNKGITVSVPLILWGLTTIAAAQTVITEFMPAPRSGEPEWIELRNCSAESLDLQLVTVHATEGDNDWVLKNGMWCNASVNRLRP